MLEYTKWENFQNVIKRAMIIACENSGHLVVRGDIKQWNQMLAETAHNAGVITNEEFAIFQNAGYIGLYGGLDVDDIHKRKNLAW